MRNAIWMIAGCLLLAGCGGGTPAAETSSKNEVAATAPTLPTAPAETSTPAAAPTDAWIGKWVGVEGLALDIAKGDTPGTYRLHIALMDGANDYAGTADAGVIRFTRDGTAETIRHTNGAETGLKWLAEKSDCLTIKPGEGFCRG